MMKNTVRALALACALFGVSNAHSASSQKTPSVIQGEINLSITKNGTGAITGPILNGILGDMALSYGGLLSSNIWSLTQTFSVNPIFSNCTGYPYFNGSLPATCSTAIPAASLSGLGSGVGAALAAGANTAGGIAAVNGTIAVGHCLQWSASGVLDTGAACGSPVPPTLLRQVATRSFVPYQLGNAQQCMVRSRHIARDNITSMQAAYAAWANAPATGEINASANLTVAASVEYPVGTTFTQVKWSGSASVTMSPGTMPLSDAASVSIPKGAVFFMRAYFTTPSGSGGMPYTAASGYTIGPIDIADGEAAICGASGVANLTMGGTVTDAQSGSIDIYPVALVAQTSVRSTLILGDSIAWGTWDTADYQGDVGSLARSIGPSMGYINAAAPGDTASALASSHTKRAALSVYVSDIINELGTNDIFGGQSASSVETSLATIYSAFSSGYPVYQTTITPQSTSTDSFTTFANQTVKSQEAVRQAVNAWIRAAPTNVTGVIEIADQVDAFRGAGKWVVPGPNGPSGGQFTPDGTHPNNVCYALIQKSGVVMTALTAGKYH